MKNLIFFISYWFVLVSGLSISVYAEEDKKISLKGDFRLRYQLDRQEGTVDRHRGRMRVRLGFTGKPHNTVAVKIGLATGAADPRSANQTFTKGFATHAIRLDFAYVRLKMKNMAILAGKMKNPMWKTTDLVWDSDIHPEGLGFSSSFPLSGSSKVLLNGGLYLLDEAKQDPSDPIMFMAQPGWSLTFLENHVFKISGAYYRFHNVQGASLPHAKGSNTADSTGALTYNYNSVGVVSEFGIGLGKLHGSIFDEFIMNLEPANDNLGYAIGLKFGHIKVSKAYTWQVSGLYRYLENDAWLDIFPDSDFRGGATNAKGFEFMGKYAVLDNMIAGLDYYFSENINGSANLEYLLQADLSLNF